MFYRNARDLFERYPTLTTGVVTAAGITNLPLPPRLGSLLAEVERSVAGSFRSDTLSQHPHIASWREAYSSFGVKPSKYNCACELLIRRVLKEGQVPRINGVVDLCNYLSLKYVVPVASYDMAGIKGGVEVGFARADEPFMGLYATEVEYPEPGEVIYRDQEKALSRRWNWRQCEQAKVTLGTRDVLFTVEGVNRIPREVVEAAARELTIFTREFFGGAGNSYMLTVERHQVPLK